MLKLEAHIFRDTRDGTNGTKVGKLVFVSHDHAAIDAIANGIHVPACITNVDVSAHVQIGHKGVWVPANPRALDDAAQQLMELARDIRKPRVVAAE